MKRSQVGLPSQAGRVSRSRQSPVAHLGPPHAGEQPLVELCSSRSTGLGRPPAQVLRRAHRRPGAAPRGRSAGRGRGRRAPPPPGARGGGNAPAARGSSWFSRKRTEFRWKSGSAWRWLRTAGGVLAVQAVVEALVVGVVEALLLELPLEVPVHLGHEDEVRMPRGACDAMASGQNGSSTGGVPSAGARGRPRCGRTPRAAPAWPCRSARRRTARRPPSSTATIASRKPRWR